MAFATFLFPSNFFTPMATVALKKHNYSQSIRTYVMLIIVTAGLGGYYAYTQFAKFSAAQDALTKEQAQVTTLQGVESQTSTDFTNLKKDFDQKYSGVLESLQSVYPLEEKYTELTRLFDQFFQANNSSFNPVFLSDIRFGQARYDANADYAILPVTMTISGTQDNFNKFLKFVENSGVLEDKTRLMDVRSISINFTSSGAAQTTATGTAAAQTVPTINVSVALNAYFQKPFLQKTVTTPGSSTATPATTAKTTAFAGSSTASANPQTVST